MYRRSEAIRWAVAAFALVAGAAAAQDAPVDATPDGAVEQYLADRGLTELLATQLRARLAGAGDKAKPALAERLGKLYVQMLDSATNADQRRRLEGFGRALLEEVPEADSYDLRVNLAKASYLHAEEIAERYRLRLTSADEKSEAEATLRALLPTFQNIGVKVNTQVERLEKLEETGGSDDEEGLRDRLAETRRIRSLAMYYAGWSGYYLGLLTGQEQFPTEALKNFGWLLNSPNGRMASVDRISAGLLHYEHVARAAIGAAMSESLRGNDDTALRWLDLIESAEDVPAVVRDQIFGRRIVVLASAKRWADLDYLLSRRRKNKGAAGLLTVGEARLLSVHSLEALGRSDLNERIRPVVEALARVGMGDLVSRGEVGQVLDLVDRYGSAQMGTEGFIVNYVRGLQAYERARKSQTDGGESADEPTKIDAVANEYRAAAGLLDAAMGTSDAGAYASERTNAAVVQGLSLFHAGDYEEAARRLELAHESAATAQQADEALWLAVVALDRAVEAGRASLLAERDRMTVLYLQSYPSGERAARLVLRSGTQAAMSDEQTLVVLLGIPPESPLYSTSRRQAARLLYKVYRGANSADKDFAGVRFLGVAEPMLAMDRDRALAGGPDAGPAAESAVALARQMLDAALSLSTPDIARAGAAIDALDRLSKQTNTRLDDFAEELAFRRFQIAFARDDRAEADSALAGLHEKGGRYSDAADRVVYRRALQEWTGSPQDPAKATALVEIGKRIIAQFPPGPEPLADPAVAAAFDTIARAAQVVWRVSGDVPMRDLSLEASRRLLQSGHKTRDVLRRIAELAEAGGQTDEALDAWRDLLAALPQDSSDWYEARYQSLRLLASADRARAAEVMQQHKLLHPDFGPEPWGSKLRDLDAQLGSAATGAGREPMSESVPIAPAPVAAPARPTPVARFLGETEASGGPFALLGLPVAALNDDQIIGALDSQLARLAGHVECNTPQADEVRLALHAAAAQLLDPRVRAHLLARWGAAAGGVPPPLPERRKFPRAPSAHVALEHDAVLTLGMFGGWNSRSLRRLMALSQARGLSTTELAEALRGLGGGVRRAVPERAAPARQAAPVLTRLSTPLPPAPGVIRRVVPSGEPLPEQIDPAEHTLKIVLLCGAAGVLLLMLSLGALVLLARRPTPTPSIAGTPPAKSPSVPQKAAVEPAAAAAADTTPAPDEPIDVDAVVGDLAACVAGIATDPSAAIVRFEGGIGALGAGWPVLAQDQMVAAQHQVIEFVYKAAPTPDIAARAVEAVAAGAGALGGRGPITADLVRSAVWSAGMLNRLAKENDLPSGLEQLVDNRLNAALGSGRPTGDQSFEAGAAAAVRAIPALLVGEPSDAGATAGSLDAWRRWIDVAGGVAHEPAAKDRLLLGGLETLLVDGPDPGADETAFKVVRLIVARLTWRPGDQSREWLLKWFDDERITSADLYAVTSALATSSSAEGVNATMVVPVLASASVRAEMRDSYAKAWGLVGGPDRADIIRQLMEAADQRLAEDDPNRSLPEILGSAVMLSRLSEAASWAWRGHAEQTQAILARVDLDVVVNNPTTPAAVNPQNIGGIIRMDPRVMRSDRGWALQYLAAKKNIQLRLDLIDKLASETQLDAVGAELLAGEAVRGSPNEVRKAAAEKVVRFGDSPLVVNGLLEELPTMPATTANLHLIETIGVCRLPGPGDPAWMMEARRSMVERLLQLVASEGELAMIDRETDLLARSFEGRIREAPPADSPGAQTGPSPAPELSAAFLYRQWRAKVDPALPRPGGLSTPEEIERRRSGRAALARGMVQAFEAQQVSACELMAYVMGAERSADAARIAGVLWDLIGDRQRAGHVFEQIRATEAATLRLWLIRLGQEPQS